MISKKAGPAQELHNLFQNEHFILSLHRFVPYLSLLTAVFL